MCYQSVDLSDVHAAAQPTRYTGQPATPAAGERADR